MKLPRYKSTGTILLLLLLTGCTFDSSGTGRPGCDPEPLLEGCFARSPEMVTPDNPEIYIQIIREEECNISGHGSYGPFAYFVYTGSVHQDPDGADLTAITGHDLEAETTNQFRISLQVAGGGGLVFRVIGYRFGSDAEWSSWPEGGATGPFYLTPVECTEESGD